MEDEGERDFSPSLSCSPGASLIDLSGSFIYTQLYLFRLTSALRRSQPITYALLTRMPSTSCGSHFHPLSVFNPLLLLHLLHRLSIGFHLFPRLLSLLFLLLSAYLIRQSFFILLLPSSLPPSSLLLISRSPGREIF